MLVITGILYIISVYVVAAVRVCPTFREYDLDASENCYNNPISEQNVTEIIQSWGLTAEEHYITTDDGYILLIERAYSNVTRNTPIILVHGIAMNGLGWIFRGEDSLVYFLCNLGYDVWVMNLRGTEYSRQHTSLSTSNIRYWYYSIHELGIYDVRQSIEYVNGRTKQKAIYIGYSMGTTSFYIYSTVFPDEAEANLKGMVGLGPAINFKGAKSLLQISAYVWPVLKPIINTLWHGEIIPGYTSVFEPFLKTSGGMYFMQTLINLIAGFDYDQMDAISYPLLSKWFDTAAVNVWTHFLQIYRSRIFQHYDYGFTRNMIIYGQLKPPPYNISKISIPVALFVGKSDWLAPVPNAEQLYSELRNSSRCGYHWMGLQRWNHYDFIMSKDIKHYLYDPLSEKILEIENGECKAE